MASVSSLLNPPCARLSVYNIEGWSHSDRFITSSAAGRIAKRFDPLDRWELKYNDGTGLLKARLL